MPYTGGGTITWQGSQRPNLPEIVHDDAVMALWDKIMRSIHDDRPLLLTGGVGTGKTVLMGYIDYCLDAKTSRKRRPRNIWLEAPNWWLEAQEYCDDVRSAWNYARQFSDWSDAFSADGIASQAQRLFIDDLGAEAFGGMGMPNPDILGELLRQRYVRQLPTWISTNLSIPQLIQRYGERVISRLCETVDVVQVVGEDRRVAAMRARAGL